MELTEEQKQRIEKNRLAALAKRQAQSQLSVANNSVTVVKKLTSEESKPLLPTPQTTSSAKPFTPVTWWKSQEKSNIHSSQPSLKRTISTTTPPINNPCNIKPSLQRNNSLTELPVSHLKGKLRFELISRTNISIQPDMRPLHSIFLTIPGHSYDSATKSWRIPASEYGKLVTDLKTLAPDLVLDTIPDGVMRLLPKWAQEERYVAQKDIPLDEMIDAYLLERLLPFQREGVQFALRHQGRLLLGDGMGVGKTVQALAIASFYRPEWPLLVIAPSSLVCSWREEILEWLPNTVHPTQIQVVQSSKDMIDSSLICIISYDLGSRIIDKIRSRRFQVIIADECHYMKNSDAQRTKNLGGVIRQAERRILLSGTPALSRPCELFTQIQMLHPQLFPNMRQFGIRYCDAKQTKWGWDYLGASHLGELNLVLSKEVMIRRVKEDVLTQLPSKRRRQVFVQVDANKVQHLSRQLTSEVPLSQEFIVGQEAVHANDLNFLSRNMAFMDFWLKTAQLKLPAMVEYVLDLVQSGRKVLLFAHHSEILNEFEENFIGHKKGYIRIDGNTKSSSRLDFCNKFQCDDQIRVALLSITAAGVGLTLTSANTVVFAELFWNPGALLQAEDRAHRLGQRDFVDVHYLLAKQTLDDKLWPMIVKKIATLEKMGLARQEYDKPMVLSAGQRTMEDVLMPTYKRPIQQTLEQCHKKQHIEKEEEWSDLDEDLAWMEACP